MPFLDNDGVTRLTTDYLDVFARKEDAILDPSGGLIRTDDGISVDSLTRESDGAISGSIVELTAEGHAEQASTTGKNLLPNTAKSKTANGVTFTVNADGSVTVNGTATANAILILCNASTFHTQPAGTYTMSGGFEGCRITMQYADSTSPDAGETGVFSAGASPSSITIQNELRIASGNYSAYLLVPNGTTVNGIVHPQLELGSEATDYEPYTGGAPSPSPDYPQEIQVVRGRNLFDISKVNSALTIAGTRIVASAGADQDIYTGEVGAASAVGSSYINVLPFLDAGTYTLTFTTNAKVKVFTVDDNGVVTNIDGTSQGLMSGSFVFTLDADSRITLRLLNNNTYVSDIQLELGSTPTPYVPYGHVGMEVQGKNLLDDSKSVSNEIFKSFGGILTSNDPDGTLILGAGTYTVSSAIVLISISVRLSASELVISVTNATSCSFTLSERAAIKVAFRKNASDSSWSDFGLQLELNDHATSYEPYHRTTTPIPLPSRGWVAGLPDGTADELRIDGAGKVEWELADAETTTAATDGVAGTIGVDVLSTTGQIADGATVLYKLATPITEDCGYVDLPDIPSDVTVSIPELDALNVKYFIANNSISQYANQWYERAKAVDIADVEDAIGDLTSVVANLVTHDQFYFGYDEVNGKKMISIFKRGDI